LQVKSVIPQNKLCREIDSFLLTGDPKNKLRILGDRL
jgi:hypothetical protein